MHFHFSFYSSLLLIFFSQGIIFSFLLWRKALGSQHNAGKWFAIFIALCSFYLLPLMLGHAGWYSVQPYRDILFYLPTQQVLFIGPVFFFYIQSALNPAFVFGRKDLLHLLPGVVYLLYSIIVFVGDVFIFRYPYFYANGRDKDLDGWYQVAGFCSMLFYWILSHRYYRIYVRFCRQVVSFADSTLFKWIPRYLVVIFGMQVLQLFFFIYSPGWGDFTTKWWYFFLFSILTYYTGLSALLQPVQSSLSFRLSGMGSGTVYWLRDQKSLPWTGGLQRQPLLDDIPVELSGPATASPDTDEWISVAEKIVRVTSDEKLYEDPELTLSSLAEVIGIHAVLLSRIINQRLGVNFNDFVNQLRVKSVQEAIQRGEHASQTLLGLAFSAGFNSKTTFNRSFMKFAGISPKAYCRKVELELKKDR